MPPQKSNISTPISNTEIIVFLYISIYSYRKVILITEEWQFNFEIKKSSYEIK